MDRLAENGTYVGVIDIVLNILAVSFIVAFPLLYPVAQLWVLACHVSVVLLLGSALHCDFGFLIQDYSGLARDKQNAFFLDVAVDIFSEPVVVGPYPHNHRITHFQSRLRHACCALEFVDDARMPYFCGLWFGESFIK